MTRKQQQPRAAARVMRMRRIARYSAVATAALLAGVLARPATAQSGNGFLFQEPSGSLVLRGGFARATAGGDLFSFVRNQFTLNQGDFSGPTVGADLALRVAPRLDVVLGTSYSGVSRTSEYRNLVDNNNAPINQTSTFQRVPVTASLRAYLTPRGRSVGRFAWVPARVAPYVGAGGGAMWYRFLQRGDFVDYNNNNSVFSSEVVTSRWTPAAQVMAGVDFSLTPRVALTGEGKYLWARGTPNQSFGGGSFRSIDLSGVAATVGLALRF